MGADVTIDTSKPHDVLGWRAHLDVPAAIERRIDAQVATSREPGPSRTAPSE